MNWLIPYMFIAWAGFLAGFFAGLFWAGCFYDRGGRDE